MISRDGLNFLRFNTAVIPEDAPADRGGNRSNYMTWGVIDLPLRPKELSVYATEAYYEGPDSRVRRFVFRKDGIVSVRARQGGLTTKPLTFSGRQLVVNYRSLSKDGSVQVEFLDSEGDPIEGFAAADCIPLTGDRVAARVTWKGKHDLTQLSGTAVKLRFVLSNADLFSIRFQ